jgi:tight adherence protein B
MSSLLPILAFASLLLLTLFVYEILRVRSRAHERLEKRLSSLGQPPPAEVAPILQEKTYSDIPQLNELLARARFAGAFDRLVLQAGLRARAGEVMLWMALVGMVAAVVVFLTQGSLLVAAVAFVLSGPGLGLWWLRRRRQGRRVAIVRQLPDTLEMLRGALQAGSSLAQALEAITEEAADPIRAELRHLTEELKLGHSLRDAFHGLYARTGIEDLRFFVVAIMLNREVGGNLSEIIGVVTQTVRERFKLVAQVRALTAQGRFSATILCGLTPSLLLALTLLNPDYLQPLYHTPMGRGALAYAAGSTAFGYYLMRRIVNIKVVRQD